MYFLSGVKTVMKLGKYFKEGQASKIIPYVLFLMVHIQFLQLSKFIQNPITMFQNIYYNDLLTIFPASSLILLTKGSQEQEQEGSTASFPSDCPLSS